MQDFSRLIETVEASLFIRMNELKKRNITISGKRTSITLEPQAWEILHDVAEAQDCSVHDLCSFINERKSDKSSLSSAIRIFLLSYLYIQNKRED